MGFPVSKGGVARSGGAEMPACGDGLRLGVLCELALFLSQTLPAAEIQAYAPDCTHD